jgi:hypothetical protein
MKDRGVGSLTGRGWTATRAVGWAIARVAGAAVAPGGGPICTGGKVGSGVAAVAATMGCGLEGGATLGCGSGALAQPVNSRSGQR